MTQMVTRCPKCSTAFRITSAQLDSAKGSVRCGSCLHIFKAKEHLVSGAATTKPEVKSTVASPATKAAAPAQKSTFTTAKLDQTKDASKPAAKPAPKKTRLVDDDEDDMLISDDMDKPKKKDAGYEFDGFLDLDMHPKQTVSLFEREIRYDEDEKEKEHTDESWAEQLLDDDESTLHQLKSPKAPAGPASKSVKKEAAPVKVPEPKKAPDVKKTAEPKPQPINKAPPPKTATPVFALINDGSDDHGPSDEFINATTPKEPRRSHLEEIEAFGAGLFDSIEEEPDQSTSSKRPSKTKMHAFDTSRAALLMNIIPAPIEFSAKRVRRWYQKKLWPTLALIAGIALLFQVAYFKFGYFSRVEPYRSVYAFVCPLIGCKLPTLVDTRQVVAAQLIVRKHQKEANALMVDAILINNAPFEQPFPDLLLAFSTLDDTPVALRRFTPREYLAGELAGMDHMPIHTPVRINLELVDPGPDAVNYHMSIP